MTDLLYIIGSGRSGSTVIERVLNSAPDIVGVGEIHALWRLPLPTLMCSCGARVPDCPFWTTALETADIGEAERHELAELENRVVRNKHLVRLRYDLDRIRRDPDIARFNALQKRLFDGCRHAGGGRIVLDSSKAGPRAWVLAGGDVSPVFVHTYRGAEDVIASWRKPKFEPSTGAPMKKPSLREAAMDWVKAEQAARSLTKVATVARVDYHHFSTDPQSSLKAALDSHFPGLVDKVAWAGPARVRPAAEYHSLMGNPDRFSREDIVIAPQRASDRATFGAVERRVIKALGRTLERFYR